MKIVGLISGGKDSIFNLLHCLSNNHELIVLANLAPPSKTDEVDSFMYQTVGHELVPSIAACMDIPLIRREIKGSAISDGRMYNATARDEVEDLYCLLKSVIEEYPEVTGVSVGAILSNYQRVRVENVCSRLGLTCFAYLWRYDQLELVDLMIECGMDAVLVKIAGMGLKRVHIGRSLGEMFETLKKLHGLYGFHPAGEGGEYETCVLDAPMFKKRIILEGYDVVTHSDDAFAPVLYISNPRVRFEVKEDYPECLDIALDILRGKRPFLKPSTKTTSRISVKSSNYIPSDVINISENSAHLFIVGKGRTLEAQANHVMISLSEASSEFTPIWRTVYLKSMSHFKAINSIYANHVGTNHPCPRACVSTNLPKDVFVTIEAQLAKKEIISETMHVQSISYWAPANIGPYSQSVILKRNLEVSEILVSGQIGMIPSSLQIPESVDTEVELSLQHVGSVLNASVFQKSSCKWDFLPVGEQPVTLTQDNLVLTSSLCFLDDSETYHIAQRKYRGIIAESISSPLIFLTVSTLPKYANVEWVVKGVFLDHNADIDPDLKKPQIVMFNRYNISEGSRVQDCTISGEILCQVITLKNVSDICRLDLTDNSAVTIYHTADVIPDNLNIVSATVPVLDIIDDLGNRNLPVIIDNVQICTWADFDGILNDNFSGVIFTSKQAVNSLKNTLNGTPVVNRNIKSFVVGKATGGAVKSLRSEWQIVGEDTGDAKSLGKLITEIYEHGQKPILFLCANIRRDTIPQTMADSKIQLVECVVYETVQSETFEHDLLSANITDDPYFVFFSPSGVDVALVPVLAHFPKSKIVAIGKTTADRITEVSPATTIIISPKPTPDALYTCIISS